MSKTTIDDKGRARRPSAEPRTRERERYTSGSEIARGGMGRVVEATDTLLGRTVALKEALSTDPEALRRFARETKITARLEHPSIVPLYDAGTSDDGSPYYVMRKVSGRPLEQLVVAAESLAERLRLLPHVVAAAQALAHAHQRKVVHRDLKPSNILVGDLGETVVIDWGLAKVLGEDDGDGIAATERLDAGASMKTRIGTVFGTPGFMAPEQLRGDPVDARVDVYALGATLYFMLARQPPHAAPSGDEMMSKAAAGPPRPLIEVAPGVPRELTTIVDKALSYREAARYPDAATFAEDLGRFLTGQLVASHRYSRRERLVRFVRRNRVPVAVVTLAVIALAIGGSVGVLRVLAERDRADAQAALATKGQRDAQDRADQLLLSQAETLVASNPTAAVALLKQLTADPVRRAALWRQVRAIAASARISGIARGLPATPHPKSIELSPAGTQAVVAGRDGSVWTYDLVAHRHRQVGQFVPDRNARFIGETALALHRERDFSFLDLETGARRDLVMPVAIWTVLVATHRIFVVSDQRELYELPLDATRGTELRRVVAGANADVQLSVDGRWIAIANDKRLAIADATQPTLAFRELAGGGATYVAWAPDGKRLVATYPKRLAWIDVETGATSSYAHEDMALAPIALSHNIMFLSSTGGIRWLQASTVNTRYIGELETGIGIHAAPDDRVVATNGNRMIILGGVNETVIVAPTEALSRVKASPTSRFLIASSPGRLMYWDLEQMMPKPRVVAKDVAAFARVGPFDYVLQRQDGQWAWLDGKAGEERVLGMLPPITAMETNKARDRLLFVEPNGGGALMYSLATRTLATIDDRTMFAVMTDDDSILLARRGGGLVLLDADQRRRRTLFSHPSELESSAWSGSWYAASYLDGLVWRRNATTGREETIRVPPPTLSRMWALRLRPDGSLFFPVDNKLMCWRADGVLVEHVVVPEPIANTYSGDDHMILITKDGGGYVVHFARPGFARSAIPAGARKISISEVGLAVFETAASTPEVVDLIAPGRWPVVRRGIGRVKYPNISDDGKSVMTLSGTEMVEYPIDVPHDAAATAAWLDRLTNATAELGPTTLTWH